jgi:transposase
MASLRSVVEERRLGTNHDWVGRSEFRKADTRQYRHPGTSARSRKKRGPDGAALGRSRGGFSTKIHTSVDGKGEPTKLILTGGQESDIKQAARLIEGQESKFVIGDKGYDSDEFVRAIETAGATAVIPPRENRIEQREYDKDLYKDRNLVERFWSRMKQFRRVATRYEKTARNFLGFVRVAAIMVLLAT